MCHGGQIEFFTLYREDSKIFDKYYCVHNGQSLGTLQLLNRSGFYLGNG